MLELKKNITKFGDILRKYRKKRGYRSNELVDKGLSRSAISRIERGDPSVSPKKIERYLSKLGLTIEDIKNLKSEVEVRQEEIKLELFSINSSIDHAGPNQTLREIRRLDLSDYSKKALAEISYYKGKCYFLKKNYPKAVKHLLQAIEESEEDQHLHLLRAMSYCYLGMIHYYQDDLKSALEYNEQGLDAIGDSDDESKELKFMLIANKAIYLEKLEKNDEALSLLQYLWRNKGEIETLKTRLHIYELKSKIYLKFKEYKKAENYAKAGIKIAQLNKEHSRAFDLWSILGNIYFEMEKLNFAERCFLTALQMEGNVQPKSLLINTYTQLGKLYMQLKKYSLSREALNKAIELGKGSKNNLDIMKTLMTLGKLEMQTNNKFKAIEYLEDSLLIAEQHEELIETQREIVHLLAKCCYKNEQKKFVMYMEKRIKLDEILSKMKEEEIQSCLKNAYRLS